MRLDHHTHRCPECRDTWVCDNAYCRSGDLCGQCDLTQFESWALERGYYGREEASTNTEGVGVSRKVV